MTEKIFTFVILSFRIIDWSLSFWWWCQAEHQRGNSSSDDKKEEKDQAKKGTVILQNLSKLTPSSFATSHTQLFFKKLKITSVWYLSSPSSKKILTIKLPKYFVSY